MPTIGVDKDEFYRRLGRTYTTEELEDLCFDFGIEYDGDNSKDIENAKAKNLPVPAQQLKIEIPANRYDLLCIEGLARALRIFLQKDQPPTYTLSTPAQLQEVFVEPSTSPLRPYFASAVLRLARPMNDLEYESFIDLQDKLHQNLCRMRKFVAIGTHDLDTIEGPFRYMCRDPKQIKFAPLNRDTEHTAEELMTIFEHDRHLAKYLHLIRDAPAYPIIYDSKDRVLSMPPIINSQHSKIVPGKTKNIFIDTTATDKTKLDIVINMVATMFAEYCAVPFQIEPVRVHMPDGSSHLSPPLDARPTTASSSYINSSSGLALSREEQCGLLTRMSLSARPSPTDQDVLDVSVPPTRPDILHECDIMEDAAIAYGFNNLPKSMPTTNTVAKAHPVNKLSDVIRKECAMAGWTEALPLILCSHDENFKFLNRTDDGKTAVSLLNPQTIEFQVVRTSLLPGLLKTIRENRSLPLPLKVFEVSDICLQDPSQERKARNDRRMGGVYTDRKAGFEMVHGLLDRVMQTLGVPFLQSKESKGTHGYYIAQSDEPTYLPGRGATVYFRPRDQNSTQASTVTQTREEPKPKSDAGPLHTIAENLKAALPGVKSDKTASAPTSSVLPTSSGADIVLGSLGILHPSVLANFELVRPCSVLEIDIEPLL